MRYMPNEMHAHEVHAHEMHAHEVHAYKIYVRKVRAHEVLSRISCLKVPVLFISICRYLEYRQQRVITTGRIEV